MTSCPGGREADSAAQPLVWPDSITVLHKLAERPTTDSTSVVMEAVILSHAHQRPAARCFEDVVVYDYTRGSKTTLPPFIVQELSDAFDLQEETRTKALHEVAELRRAITSS